MVTHDAEDRRTVVLRECAAATSAVIVTGCAATVVTPDAYRRALILAVVCTVVSALCSDWAARVTTAVSGSLAFMLWLGYPQLAAPWEGIPLFGFAVLLGTGYRRITRDNRVEQQ